MCVCVKERERERERETEDERGDARDGCGVGGAVGGGMRDCHHHNHRIHHYRVCLTRTRCTHTHTRAHTYAHFIPHSSNMTIPLIRSPRHLITFVQNQLKTFNIPNFPRFSYHFYPIIISISLSNFV